MEVTIMDERGRVTIGKELGQKFGGTFFVIETYKEIVLMPKPKDPLKTLKEWGRKSGIDKFSMKEIDEMVKKESEREAMGKPKNNKKR